MCLSPKTSSKNSNYWLIPIHNIPQFDYSTHWQEEEITIEKVYDIFPDIHFHLCIFLKSTNNDESLGFNIGGGIKEPPTYIYVDNIDKNSPINTNRLLQ